MKYIKYFEGKKDRFPNLKKIEKDEFVIYVGGDAKSNDYLTFNMTNDDDIWLHAMGLPGSHVVIKIKSSQNTQEKTLPTDVVLRFAAELAKKHSKAPKDQPCDVRWCQKKFVYKTPNMNTGEVGIEKQIEMDSTKKITI